MPQNPTVVALVVRISFLILGSFLGGILGDAQSLFLALQSEITPGGIQGII